MTTKRNGNGPPCNATREWALYRVGLRCKIGRDALEGKGVPSTCSAAEYALFNLLHAVEDIARAMGTDVPLTGSKQTEKGQAEQLVRRGAVRRLLVGTGLVYEEAIDDAKGFDGETTLGRVVEFEESLIELLAPNAGGDAHGNR